MPFLFSFLYQLIADNVHMYIHIFSILSDIAGKCKQKILIIKSQKQMPSEPLYEYNIIPYQLYFIYDINI